MTITHINQLTDIMPTVRFFWSKVQKTDGCWQWTGANRGMSGRGTIQVRIHATGYKLVMPAYRFSYLLHNEEIPKRLPYVCHDCDNPICVRPDHLYAGTASENNHDTWDRGRRVNVKRGLYLDVAAQIRAEYEKGGVSLRDLGKKYGIPGTAVSGNSTVYRIVNRLGAYKDRETD